MAINTMLWTLSYPAIRRDNPKPEVDNYLEIALEAIFLSSMKWPGVESALELYITLVEACQKAYEGNPDASYGIRSPKVNSEDRSVHDMESYSAFSTPSSVSSSLGTTSSDSARPLLATTEPGLHDVASSFETNPVDGSLREGGHMATYAARAQRATSHNPLRSSHAVFNGQTFDPNSIANPLPTPLAYGTANIPNTSLFEHENSSSAFAEPYTWLFHPDFVSYPSLDGLDTKGQSELMSNLEANGLHRDVSKSSPGRHLNTTEAL